MIQQSPFSRLRKKIHAFHSASGGNVMVMFALALVPIVGSVGVAVDYSQSSSVKAAMQGALDAAALGTVKIASTLQPAQVQSTAVGFFNASFNRPQATSAGVTSQYDAATSTLTLTASTTVKANFTSLIGISQMSVSATSKATLGGTKTWPVCVLVTSPDENHTLLAKNNGKIDFDNCMVQVNTNNWDAVESRDTSYIHSTNGQNCFVGDIHYGDVKPPKDPTCTLLPDPFAAYTVPTKTCDPAKSNLSVKENATLSPGTYCGGININASNINVTFSPGVYYIQDGDLQILGSSNVTANGVTFLISGSNSNLNFNTTGTITMSPNIDAAAGQWAGFLFYYDQPAAKANKKGKKEGKNTISSAKMNVSGIIYLVNQTLNITGGAVVTVNPGTIVADFILPDNGTLNLTGTMNSSSAAQTAMRKSVASNTPVLVK